MNEETIKQIIAAILIGILLVFTFLIIKPIFIPIVLGLVLAYTFNPVNKLLLKYIKNKFISALITCSVSIAIMILITWFSLPLLINQIFDAYITIQSFDTLGLLKKIFPFLFSSPQISANFAASYNTFLSTTTQTSLEKLTGVLSDLPSLILKLAIVVIVFFYALRDGDKIIELLKDSLPFNKSTTIRFIQKSKSVTFSTLFGRIVIGIVTGILSGIGFYFAGVQSTLLLTVLAIITSIIPIVGPWIVWIPVTVGLFLSGQTSAGVFLLIYSATVVTLFETISHPIIISKQSQIPNSLTIIGLIGGMLVFGIFGIILGPLIIAYLVVLFEIYRDENTKKK